MKLAGYDGTMMHLTFDAEMYVPLRHDRNFTRIQEKTWTYVLDLLDRYDVRVTNFVTWEFATTFPDLLKRMVSAGHETASHSLNHRSFRDLSADQFEVEIRESKRRLDEATGQSVIGFRAPYLQAPPDLAQTLARYGYSYDSSLAATFIPRRFSGLLTPKHPYTPSHDNIRREAQGASMWEIPISVSPLVRVPFGGFFLSFVSPFVQVLPGIRGEPNVMFLHPYDFVDLSAFPGSYPWDRHKFTKGNWRLLEYFGRMMTGRDATLKQLITRADGGKPAYSQAAFSRSRRRRS